VYANYGRPEDFDALESLGVDVKGKIVLVRYGKCFRGLKVNLWLFIVTWLILILGIPLPPPLFGD